jgi:Uma2 family endonuclease
LIGYLFILLQAYFEWKPIGEVIIPLFPMKLKTINHGRMPDLIVALSDYPLPNSTTFVDGPADICFEVVSPESVGRDRGKKFDEYERGGVSEYWLIDPLRKEARFYRMDGSGHYQAHDPNSEGFYRTPALPGFRLQVSTLFQEKLPMPGVIVAAVEAMKSNSE